MILELLYDWGVPVAITGLFFWLLKRSISKRDAERQKYAEEQEAKALAREKHREEIMLLQMQSNRAVYVLSEATARAVQRIPDANCNGDMTEALKYATTVQRKEKDKLVELGLHSIFE